MITNEYTDLKDKWDQVLEKISQKVSKPIYDGMIKTTYPLSMDENLLVISTPNDFTKEWISTRYKEHYSNAIKEISDMAVSIDFIVQEKAQEKSVDSVTGENETSPQPEEKKEILKKNVSVHTGHSNTVTAANNLNSKYTFESFVIGNHNRFSNAAAQRAADSPGHAYNPLFIYGGVGLGKTHLMHAIGNQMILNSKDTKVAYLSSEKFTNELINSIKDDKMTDFKNKYRSIDLLLIDDIQFIERKERTQEEFFHTFNALYDEGKQIVISSDRPPKEISALEERLRSRFEMGLITDIQAPDFETRIAILKKKSEIENIDVSDEILYYIANAFKDNVRELEGALLRVIAYAQLTNIPATVNLAKTILGREPSKEITLDGIQKSVAKFYGVEIEDLLSNLKTKEITWARHVAMYLSRDLTKYSLQRISQAFGRKDHTTIIHAFEKIKNLVQTDPEISKEVQKILEMID